MTEDPKMLAGGRITRRTVLRRAALLGLSTPAVAALLAACGGGNSSTATSAAATTAATAATGGATTPAVASATASASTPMASGTPAAQVTLAPGWTPRPVSVKLTGSGSSFVDPAMQLWIQAYQKLAPNVTVNYQSVGSGQGKKDFIGKVTDFAGTDAYMTDDEMKQAPGTIHIPVVLGPVVIAYNLPGVSKLQFSGPTIADIFLGKITAWNDKEIAADNPGVNLPNTPITVAHRSDGSGTTAIFTNYLSKVSQEWSDKVGFGTAVQWPVGVGGQQNPGVAAAIQQTPGGIGYVELAYALQNNLPTPAVKNESGNYVVPSLDSVAADAAAFLPQMPDDLRVFITDPKTGANAYPITGFSWLLLRPSYDDANKAKALTDFCYWIVTAGQPVSGQLKYAPLPGPVQQVELQKLTQVQSGGQAVFTIPS